MNSLAITQDLAPDRIPDESSVHHLYSQHNRWLIGWLTNKLDCPQNAFDLSQDTFMRIIAKGNASSIEQPRAYLTTIAKGLLVNWYRRQSLERCYLEALAQNTTLVSLSSEQYHLVLETLNEIDAALDTLKPAIKNAFLLAQIEGLKYQQIADNMGISLITVKRYIKQALVHCLAHMPD
jgi:RNA polymerase sigma-70 factor (ECF subfamily)